MKRRSRRSRRKDFAIDLVLAVLCLLIWLPIFSMIAETWAEHPGEQPITYAEHMESIGGSIYVMD